jgi:hypothetical protein
MVLCLVKAGSGAVEYGGPNVDLIWYKPDCLRQRVFDYDRLLGVQAGQGDRSSNEVAGTKKLISNLRRRGDMNSQLD